MGKELPEVINSPFDSCPTMQEMQAPSVVPDFPQPDYDQDTSNREFNAIDILQNKYNFGLVALAAKQARGVDSLIKCALALDRLQERRRHLLGRPYGASLTAKKETVVYPLD